MAPDDPATAEDAATAKEPVATTDSVATKGSVAIIGSRGYPSHYGGFETLVRHLAPYLAEEGWQVTVYNRRTDPTRAGEPHPAVNVVTIRGSNRKSLSTLTHGFTSSAHATRREHDVALVLNVANGYYLPVLRARGTRTLVNVDGIEWERAKWGQLARGVFRGGAALTARYADRLVVDSRCIGDHWKQNFGRDGLFIPYGAETPGPLPVPNGLTSGEYALMVARLVPENTVDEFLTAAEHLSDERDVVIVGSSGSGGPLEDRLRALTEERPRVHWLGHVSDDDLLFALWQHAGAYFHGHSVGGTNPALVQAMACRAPIVALDTVFNREVLADGALYTPPNAADIFAAVQECFEEHEPREVRRKIATERQQAEYTWSVVCAAYSAALEELRSR